MERQQVTIHYRRLTDLNHAFSGHTLETAIRAALRFETDGGRLSEHWKRRAWSIPPSNQETTLMNNYHDGGSYFFGDLTHYTQGEMQPLIQNAEDAPILNVEQQPPPAGREYVHAMMYWYVRGNHVLIVQSRALTVKQLEIYLGWLLRARTEVIADPGHVVLQAEFHADEVGGDLDDIRELVIGGTSISSVARPPGQAISQDVDTYHSVASTRSKRERAMDVLRTIFSSEADVENLVSSLPEEAELQVSVHIGYKTTKRLVSRLPMQQALRNLPEGEVTAIGKHGRLTGSDIRLSCPANILKRGSLLNPEDVLRAFNDAYGYFVEHGKIRP